MSTYDLFVSHTFMLHIYMAYINHKHKMTLLGESGFTPYVHHVDEHAPAHKIIGRTICGQLTRLVQDGRVQISRAHIFQHMYYICKFTRPHLHHIAHMIDVYELNSKRLAQCAHSIVNQCVCVFLLRRDCLIMLSYNCNRIGIVVYLFCVCTSKSNVGRNC